MDKSALIPICHKSLIAYAIAQSPEYRAAEHHHLIADALERVKDGTCTRLIINMPPRHGKACADDTPILTANRGWTTHGEIEVGDTVFHTSGSPAKVVAIGAPTVANRRITLSDGSFVDVHENHEWEVRDRSTGAERVLETKQIEKRELLSGGRCTLQVPLQKAVEFNETTLPIDPYVLGAWLGDGSKSGANITRAPADTAVLVGFEDAGHSVLTSNAHPVTGVIRNSFSDLYTRLRKTGLLGNKHIPAEYMRASIDQRKRLIAGLVDTDGHVCPDTGRVRIVTTLPALRDQLVEMLRCLGQYPYVSMQEPALTSSGIQGRLRVYTVGFQPDIEFPTRLPRKQNGRMAPRRRLGIVSVQPIEPRPGRCIQVDREDGMYLVGRTLIPTHNSMLVSEFFPAWYFGHHPGRQILHASYGQDMVDGFGRKIRNQLKDDLYGMVFPTTRLSDDSQAANKFNTTKGGAYFAVGVGGSATGRGAHLLLIDDPIKDRAEADSETIRNQLKDWYSSVGYTRLMKPGAIVIVQTRWHPSDLAGWLIEEHGHENWEVLNLPAIEAENTPDEKPLWPDFFSLEMLRNIRTTLIPRDWSALYQQRPVASTGGDFKRAWLNFYDTVRVLDMPKILLVDPAGGRSTTAAGKRKGDYTTMWCIGLGTDDNYYALDCVRDRLNLTERTEALFRLHRKWRPQQVRYEQYGMQTDIEHIKSEMNRRSYRFAITEVGGAVKKEDRIRRLIPLFQKGQMWLPQEIPYTDSEGKQKDLVKVFVEDEYMMFDASKHDDMLDSLSRIAEPKVDLPWPNKATSMLPTLPFEVLDSMCNY